MLEMVETVQQEGKTLEDQVRRIVDEVLSGRDLFLVEIDIRGQKGSRAVDVYIDNDTGVGIDTLAEVSREIGFLLETEDVIAGRYNLNVSSPGAERPLQHLRQYRKHIGRSLEVVRKRSETGDTETLAGKLVSVDDRGIVIETEKNVSSSIDHNEIETARVQLPW